MTELTRETVAASPRSLSTGWLAAMTGVLLLAGGVLLDLDRINAVQVVLDRVAQLAAIEAAASPRASERVSICEKRFARTVWTETEVTVDDISVSVDGIRSNRTATVSYDATVKLAVGRYFGFDQVTISGEAEVSAPEMLASFTAP